MIFFRISDWKLSGWNFPGVLQQEQGQ